MGNSSNEQSYYLNINIIGESMYLFYLYLTRNIHITTKTSDKKEKKTLIDFWDIHYKLNKSFKEQIKQPFEQYIKLKKENNTNIKEVLIVHVPSKNSELIDSIFSKMENELVKQHYMPMVLFLYDEENLGETKNGEKIVPDPNKYPNINKNTIYTEYYINDKEYLYESEQNELTEEGFNKMEKIMKVLYRFCSYLNDLGDRFSIGEKDQQINYDLCDNYFPFTLNICCIGRFGKGKSTCANFILDEEKAKESNSGASTTKNINCYQTSNQPIQVYDIPGFESQETVDNTIQKLKELNDEINELKDNIHVILYIIDSHETRMFQEIEYNMLKYISEQNNSKLCYVLTHCSNNINKEEKIDMINNGIKSVINRRGNDKENNFFYQIRANENNTVFVNFHPEKGNPVCGLKKLLMKIVEFSKENRSYHTLNKNNLTKDEYEKKINEEADLRKKKAENVVKSHSIYSGIVGVIPFADMIVQHFVIKKSAATKIGQIFGIDLEIINNSNHLSNKATGYVNDGIGIGCKIAGESPQLVKQIRQIVGKLGAKTLKSFSNVFLFVGIASGTGLGYYFMKSDIEKMIEVLYEYFKKHVEEFSDSFDQAIQYLINRANNYQD